MQSNLPIAEVLDLGVRKLKEIVQNPRLDAELLLAYVLKVDRSYLFLQPNVLVKSQSVDKYLGLIKRRSNHEPIAYILGRKEFWGLDYLVSSKTLIPRPDSETMIEFVLQEFGDNAKLNYHILDLGTGSGCLGLTLLHEFSNASATLVDICSHALEVARKNAERLGLPPNRAKFTRSNWFENLEHEWYDIVVCNPPYIIPQTVLMKDVDQYEPHQALFGMGPRGLGDYETIAKDLKHYLKPSIGLAFFEFGIGQELWLKELFIELGYEIAGCKQDLAGIARVLAIRLKLK